MTSFPSLLHPGVLLQRPVNLKTAGDNHHDFGEKISSLCCSTLSILHFFLLSLLLGSIHNVSFALSQSHCSQHCQQWVTSILLMSSWTGMEWPSLHTGPGSRRYRPGTGPCPSYMAGIPCHCSWGWPAGWTGVAPRHLLELLGQLAPQGGGYKDG